MRVRVALVVLLVGGAFLAIRPLADCVAPFGILRGLHLELLRLCMFGFENTRVGPVGPGPLWWWLVIAIVYLAAAVWLLRETRSV